jgi:Bacterial lectin
VFQFRFTDPGGIDPADGITFVLAATSTGLGAGGGQIGYGGVPNSVAIEFDTFNTGGGDGNSSNHVGIDTNGVLTDTSLTNVYGKQT